MNTTRNPMYRFWMITMFEYPDDITLAQLAERTQGNCTYLCGQEEICPNTGRKHLQLYYEGKSIRFNRLKGFFPTAHLESRKGKQADAIKYCTKEESRYRSLEAFGTPREQRQGRRSDLALLADAINNNESQLDVAQLHPATWIRNYKGLEKYARLVKNRVYTRKRVRMNMGKGFVLYGASGVGKSTALTTIFSEQIRNGECAFLSFDGKYFDGYAGEDIVIFDDQCWSHFSRSLLLNLVNLTPWSIRVMRDYVPFTAKLVIFCSNFNPADHSDMEIRHTWQTEEISRRYQILPELTRQESLQETIELVNRWLGLNE
jgi:hypothetical protein